jgi:5-oxopent-3-ene-1,2,5-tricarboxylate decarboxylase/2-hydroxyhepta-2,4-diene-1,7-dioate isomerase
MIFGVGPLIAHLSRYLTLGPGDVILTGTPKGVVNVNVGDEVVTEIDGIGRLVGYIEAEPAGAGH